jgi:hypothetical protein
MWDQDGRNAHVEIDYLPFRESSGGIENLLKVRETEAPALHVDDGGRRHKTMGF